MTRVLLIVGMLSLAATIAAQCSASDHPSCASWAKNGFCTNPGYTKAYIQKYCPKTCTNCGCTCPGKSTLVGPAVGNTCPSGALFGSVCCIEYSNPSMIIGPSAGSMCPIGSVMVLIPGGSPQGDCVKIN